MRVRNRWPAWLDLARGMTGLVLVLFLWAHLLAVSSILLGEQAMYRVTRFFEGSWMLDQPQPLLVSLVALVITALVAVHAGLALLRLPAGYRQYRALRQRLDTLHHRDSSLWWLQVLSGLVLVLLLTPHLYQMIVYPDQIGPYASARRIATYGALPLAVIFLVAAELHAATGLYRLFLKWGWFGWNATAQRRDRLRLAMIALIVFTIALGLLTQLAFVKIAMAQRDPPDQRYQPALQEER